MKNEKEKNHREQIKEKKRKKEKKAKGRQRQIKRTRDRTLEREKSTIRKLTVTARTGPVSMTPDFGISWASSAISPYQRKLAKLRQTDLGTQA